MNEPNPFKTSHCPVCGSAMGDKIVVCRDCFMRIPTKDRVELHGMYLKHPNNFKPYASKARKVIRDLLALNNEAPA
jgi:predicted amidophosphoribosyltransferase